MKILFLDHQGVMYTKIHPNPGILDNFDPNCVKILNDILLSDTEIEIVISSDWKYWVPLEEMREFYRKQNVLKAPIDYTPKTLKYNRNKYHIERSLEIKKWLSENPTVIHWVSIDDLNMTGLLDNFVWISQPKLGLQQEDSKDKILKSVNN